MYQPPPGYAVVTVSLAIVHRQADFTPPSLRDTSPENFSVNFRGRTSSVLGNIAVPLFFAEKEGDENCELQFGGGYYPKIK